MTSKNERERLTPVVLNKIDLNQVIKEMYEGVNTTVNNQRRYRGEEFPMTVGLH